MQNLKFKVCEEKINFLVMVKGGGADLNYQYMGTRPQDVK